MADMPQGTPLRDPPKATPVTPGKTPGVGTSGAPKQYPAGSAVNSPKK